MPDPKPQGSTPKDPVCGREANPESPFRTTYEGREYLFCGQHCLTKFIEDPAQYGPNEIEEQKTNALLKFLSYFWGPIPWMIEIAAILSAIVKHWDGFAIISVLLVFNALVGFWQEYKAANALEALKKNLALKARVVRDGKWQEVPAGELVPGDVIRLRLGDIIPAGEGFLRRIPFGGPLNQERYGEKILTTGLSIP
jgi:YHS domain-containing protein